MATLGFILNQAAAPSVVTPQNVVNDYPAGGFHELSVDLTLTSFTGGTTPSINILTQRKGADGVYYTVDTPTPLTSAGSISRSIGGGLGIANNFIGFGDVLRVQIVIVGAPTAALWTASVMAK